MCFRKIILTATGWVDGREQGGREGRRDAAYIAIIQGIKEKDLKNKQAMSAWQRKRNLFQKGSRNSTCLAPNSRSRDVCPSAEAEGGRVFLERGSLREEGNIGPGRNRS